MLEEVLYCFRHAHRIARHSPYFLKARDDEAKAALDRLERHVTARQREGSGK